MDIDADIDIDWLAPTRCLGVLFKSPVGHRGPRPYKGHIGAMLIDFDNFVLKSSPSSTLHTTPRLPLNYSLFEANCGDSTITNILVGYS